ncbi:hypothetical protein [Neobacillus sp. D3-1R]|uniref:hypothetical protein n=1 Tax=Neobacillus sp. D3-1R TaxID=3445778 RepID=UPI003FA04A13
MSETYTDYINKTAITLPDTYIDVKTGETFPVSPVIQEQIEYHAYNNTLIHLVLSALDQYLHPRKVKGKGGSEEILFELLEIKKMLVNVSTIKDLSSLDLRSRNQQIRHSMELKMEDLNEVLEAFGG